MWLASMGADGSWITELPYTVVLYYVHRCGLLPE